ncbi:MAG: hypothetical protein J0L55_02220 [Caulobacterales bacterium]|nr:hypothetical protein [Caulobacterales bacterium]MCA0372182.1 hypothetical protein [Pseudomonadota bacterium]
MLDKEYTSLINKQKTIYAEELFNNSLPLSGNIADAIFNFNHINPDISDYSDIVRYSDCCPSDTIKSKKSRAILIAMRAWDGSFRGVQVLTLPSLKHFVLGYKLEGSFALFGKPSSRVAVTEDAFDALKISYNYNIGTYSLISSDFIETWEPSPSIKEIDFYYSEEGSAKVQRHRKNAVLRWSCTGRKVKTYNVPF